MNITKTINTATVTLATVEVKDGKPETRTSDIKLYSCYPLSDAKIEKAVRKIDPKATIVAANQSRCKYAVKIEEFVKIAHVEQ